MKLIIGVMKSAMRKRVVRRTSAWSLTWASGLVVMILRRKPLKTNDIFDGFFKPFFSFFYFLFYYFSGSANYFLVERGQKYGI